MRRGRRIVNSGMWATWDVPKVSDLEWEDVWVAEEGDERIEWTDWFPTSETRIVKEPQRLVATRTSLFKVLEYAECGGYDRTEQKFERRLVQFTVDPYRGLMAKVLETEEEWW